MPTNLRRAFASFLILTAVGLHCRAGSPVSLGKVLNDAGALAVSPGFQGALDPAGYVMSLDPSGAPRFRRAAGADGTARIPGGASGAKDQTAALQDGWDIRFARSGAGDDNCCYDNIQVSAVVSDGTNLYVGGTFTAIGLIHAASLARWDGARWWPLGDGLTTGPGTGAQGGTMVGSVRALAVHGGALYAAGSFPIAGDQYANNIARWDGAAWHSLGANRFNGAYVAGQSSLFNGLVTSLLFIGDDLYAGGAFDTAGGAPAANIARWDGAVWHAVGAGLGAEVDSLATDGVHLFAGGVFGGAVQGWDGTNWNVLGGGLVVLGSSGSADVTSMTVFGGRLICTGIFDTVYTGQGIASAGALASWDGTNWAPMSIQTAEGGAVACTGNPGYACFYRTGPVINFGGALYMGATVLSATGALQSGLLQWNGTNWNVLDTGLSSGGLAYPYPPVLYGIAADARGVYLTGDFKSLKGAASASGVVAWNGQSLVPFDEGTGQGAGFYNVDAYLSQPQAIAPLPGGELYAAVGPLNPPGGVGCNGLARWDGRHWHSVGEGVENGVNGTVYALYVDGTNLYVGGSFATAGSQNANNIARWDGAAWHALGGGFANGVTRLGAPSYLPAAYVNAIARHGADLLVGGSFNTAGSVSAVSLARWDGAQWHAVAPAFDGDGYGESTQVRAMAEGPDGLYLAGQFGTAAGQPFNFVARWDGSSLQSVGGGLGSAQFVVTVAAGNGGVYFGGDLSYVNGVPAPGGVAFWDGQAWSTLPDAYWSGTNLVPYTPIVVALALDGTNLYAAGQYVPDGLIANRFTSVSRWDGTGWQNLSAGFGGEIIDYLSGYPKPPHPVAADIAALAITGRSLYVTGGLQTVGDKASYGIARYSLVPYVSVSALADTATPGAPGVFQFTRTGSTAAPLSVSYAVGGAARPGVDYIPLPGVAAFPAGAASVTVAVSPLVGTPPATNASVTVTLSDTSTATAGVPSVAQITLAAGPGISHPSWLSASLFQFTITGPTGVPLTVESSSDLKTWATIGAVTLSGPSTNWQQEVTPAVTPRFYRVVSP